MHIDASEIYICNLLDYTNEEINVISNMIYILPKMVQERISTIRNEQNKIRSIMAWMMFCFLSDRYNYDTTELALGIYGKPYLRNSNVNFNISHSGQWIVIGFSNSPIGVDVEEKEVTNVHKVLEFFSDNDREYFYTYCGDVKKAFKFFWSAKEAWVKYLGIGLKSIFSGDITQWKKDDFLKSKQLELNNGAALSIYAEDDGICCYNIKITEFGLKVLNI